MLLGKEGKCKKKEEEEGGEVISRKNTGWKRTREVKERWWGRGGWKVIEVKVPSCVSGASVEGDLKYAVAVATVMLVHAWS